MRTWTTCSIAAVAAAAVLTGCGSHLAGSVKRPAADAPAVTGGMARGAPSVPSADTPVPLVADPSAVIRTATLSVRVAHQDLGQQADRAGAIAAAAGGSVFADDRTTGEQPGARLVLKVPPASLTPVLTQLAGLGVEQSRQLSSVDVTSTVADVNARVASARASIARLQALYGQAVKVSDVIAIETELASRQADLESLEAKQRALAAQTTYATITLTLSTPGPAAEPAPRRGFVGGLLAGWRHFVDGAQAVATALGAAVPFAAFVALLGGSLWLLRRRRATRTEAGLPAADG